MIYPEGGDEMISFGIDSVMSELRKVVVNEEMGVEKTGEFKIHESLAEPYLKTILGAVDTALRTALGLVRLDPTAKPGK